MVLGVMQDNKEPEFQISGLKLFTNLTQEPTVRETVGNICLDHVMSLMVNEEYAQNPRLISLACLLLANLAVDSSENNEAIARLGFIHMVLEYSGHYAIKYFASTNSKRSSAEGTIKDQIQRDNSTALLANLSTPFLQTSSSASLWVTAFQLLRGTIVEGFFMDETNTLVDLFPSASQPILIFPL